MIIAFAITLATVTGGLGEKAPPIDTTTLDGKAFKLADQAGKVVLVDFWATWCEPCRGSLPEYAKLSKRYGDKLVVLGVALDVERDPVVAFRKKHALTFPIVLDAKGVIAERYDPPAMPTAYLIGPKGRLHAVFEGVPKGHHKRVVTAIDRLLPSPPTK